MQLSIYLTKKIQLEMFIIVLFMLHICSVQYNVSTTVYPNDVILEKFPSWLAKDTAVKVDKPLSSLLHVS